MAVEYYAYILGPDGHIRRRIDFAADNDHAALEWAGHLIEDDEIEVWSGAKIVGRLPRLQRSA